MALIASLPINIDIMIISSYQIVWLVLAGAEIEKDKITVTFQTGPFSELFIQNKS